MNILTAYRDIFIAHTIIIVVYYVLTSVEFEVMFINR